MPPPPAPDAAAQLQRELSGRPGRGALPPTFDLIPRAKEVYEAIRTAQRGDGLSAPR